MTLCLSGPAAALIGSALKARPKKKAARAPRQPKKASKAKTAVKPRLTAVR